MFGSSRSVVAVEAAVASFLDLASHARLAQCSRAIGRVCRLRESSPQVVALWRVLPVVADGKSEQSRPSRPNPATPPPPPPGQIQTRAWTALGRVYYGGYRRVRDLALDDGRHEYVHRPPPLWSDLRNPEYNYDLPVRHTVWHMAPRVLDLCHLQLTSETVRRLITHATPALRHFCVDATRVDDILGILGDATPPLEQLCLYGVPLSLHLSAVLARLPLITRLVGPATNEFLDNRQSYASASAAAAADGRMASRLSHLALLVPHEYPSSVATERVEWRELGAAVPELVDFGLVDTRLGTSAVRQLLAVCPRLVRLRCGEIFRDRDVEKALAATAATARTGPRIAVPVPPGARSLLHRHDRPLEQVGYVDSVSALRALEPDFAALDRLDCDFCSSTGAQADADDGVVSSGERQVLFTWVLVRFTRLRSLTVWGDFAFDTAFLTSVCSHLSLLEALCLAGRRFPRGEADEVVVSAPASRSSAPSSSASMLLPASATGMATGATVSRRTIDGASDGDARERPRFFQLLRLVHLRDLQLAWLPTNLAAEPLPLLSELTEFSALYTRFSTTHAVARFPNLVNFTPPADIASDAALESVARMPRLQVLRLDSGFGPAHLARLMRMRRANGITAPLTVRVAWPHDYRCPGGVADRSTPAPTSARHKKSRVTPSSAAKDKVDGDRLGDVRLICCGSSSVAERERERFETKGSTATRTIVVSVLFALALDFSWRLAGRLLTW